MEGGRTGFQPELVVRVELSQGAHAHSSLYTLNILQELSPNNVQHLQHDVLQSKTETHKVTVSWQAVHAVL